MEDSTTRAFGVKRAVVVHSDGASMEDRFQEEMEKQRMAVVSSYASRGIML